MTNKPYLVVEQLKKYYQVQKMTVKALDGVDLEVQRGECIGIVGESGSGKTTLAKLILGIEQITSGDVTFKGSTLSGKRSKELRRKIQVVQQNPMLTLNPKRTIMQTVGLPLKIHGGKGRRNDRERVAELLETVGLATEIMDRYPSALSGGQRQRAALARALATEPELIILDEPTSALDVSVQARILALLQSLQARFSLTFLFITHDLSVIRNMASSLAVMYRGRIIEAGETLSIFDSPRHHYTAMLLSSVPVISEEEQRVKPKWTWTRSLLEGEEQHSNGCPFAPRCPEKKSACWDQVPFERTVGEKHIVRCHYPRQRIRTP
jgi:peptide/nickel transport system ATP-binding protein/oligopeptide transport system ATP-binding protein